MKKGSTDFNKEFYKDYRQIKAECKDQNPKLLLHVCCGACSCYPLIFLANLFDVTVLFTNSNISTIEEFETRYKAFEKHANFIEKPCKTSIFFVKDDYNYEEFRKDLLPLKDEKEGGARCYLCITKRMKRLFEYAQTNGFKYVSTIMSISRNKDAEFINTLGKKLENQYPGIKFLTFDFKKNEGQEIGVNLSKLEGIYRQDFCGCEFSTEIDD